MLFQNNSTIACLGPLKGRAPAILDEKSLQFVTGRRSLGTFSSEEISSTETKNELLDERPEIVELPATTKNNPPGKNLNDLVGKYTKSVFGDFNGEDTVDKRFLENLEHSQQVKNSVSEGYVFPIQDTVSPEDTTYVLENALVNSKYFSAGEHVVEGAAFYQTGIYTHYGVWFNRSSFDVSWFKRHPFFVAYFSKMYSNIPAISLNYWSRVTHFSCVKDKLFMHFAVSGRNVRRFDLDWMLRGIDGGDWGAVNSNKHTRILYNDYAPHTHWDDNEVGYLGWKIIRSVDRQIRGYMSSREIAQYLWIATHKAPSHGMFGFRRRLPYHFNYRHFVTNPMKDTGFYSYLYTARYSMDTGYGRSEYRTVSQLVTHLREAYLPTYTVPSEFLNVIYQQQDWLSLLTAKSADIEDLVYKSKVVNYWEISHFYNACDVWAYNYLYSERLAIYLFFTLVITTAAEIVIGNEKFYAKYLDVWIKQYWDLRNFDPTFPFYDVREDKLPFLDGILFVTAFYYVFEEQNFLFNRFIYLSKYHTDFGYWWDFVRGIFTPEWTIIAWRWPKHWISRIHGYYIPQYDAEEWHDLIDSYLLLHEFKETGPYAHSKGSLLLYNDITRLAEANLKLSYDQAIYNFYRHRNGYFIGNTYFYKPGMERIDSVYSMRTWLTHYYNDKTYGMPLWFNQAVDRSLGFYRFEWRSRRDLLSTKTQFIETSHLDSQGKFVPPRYMKWYGPRHKYWFSTYYGAVNERNQSPLYDAELLKIRYGFDPYFSNYTSYGNKWLRIVDHLEADVDIPADTLFGAT